MLPGFWNAAKANKENIFYTVLTIFLLERVRRGWNRLAERGRSRNLPAEVIENRQQWFVFRAALLYALPFVLPAVKYIYRSVGELSEYVAGLAVLSSLWALAVVVLAVEALLAVLIYNLLGIYVERMNAALGFFRRMGRSVVDGSRLAVTAGRARIHAGARAGACAGVRASEGVGHRIATGTRMVGGGLFDGGREAARWSFAASRRVAGVARRGPGGAWRLLASQLATFK